MAEVKFVTYCMNHQYFVHEEENPHLDVFPEHVLVEFMVTSGFLANTGNFLTNNITTPVSGTPTTVISGFNSLEEAMLSLQENMVAIAGSTMTGFLTLSADPTASGHAATRQYVDEHTSGKGVITISFTS